MEIHRTFSQDDLTYKPYSNPTSGYFIMPGCCGEIASCTGETNGSLMTTKEVEFIEYKGNKLYLNNNVLTINSGETSVELEKTLDYRIFIWGDPLPSINKLFIVVINF